MIPLSAVQPPQPVYRFDTRFYKQLLSQTQQHNAFNIKDKDIKDFVDKLFKMEKIAYFPFYYKENDIDVWISLITKSQIGEVTLLLLYENIVTFLAKKDLGIDYYPEVKMHYTSVVIKSHSYVIPCITFKLNKKMISHINEMTDSSGT